MLTTSDCDDIEKWLYERRAFKEALEKIASPFRFASSDSGVDYEGIAREFSRRQKIAVEALKNVQQETDCGA